MELATLLIVGLIVACCVIPMLFFMGKRGSKKSADKPDVGSNKS